ncbi:MAG: cyanophycin synthetase, partial [Rhodothermales bacterium]
EDIKRSFIQYANSVPFFGAAILCLDDAVVQEIVSHVDRRMITYGTSRQAEIRAENIRQDGLLTSFTVVAHGKTLGVVNLQTPGLHNVQNALAAVSVGLELEIDFDKINAALTRFTGVQRRFQKIGEHNGILVVDDYAHHPTEVSATLAAANEGWSDRRIVAVFQPHLYSRTRDFKEGFARAFFNADVLVVTDVFGSREEPLEGVSGKMLADLAIKFGHRNVKYVADKEDLPDFLMSMVKPGDTVITMGAGDIWRYGRKFLEKLSAV